MRWFFVLLKFAIDDFLDDRKFNNVTENTIITYKYYLKEFQEFCNERQIVNVEDINKQIVKSYLVHCQKKGNNPTSINSKLTRVRAFLNFMVDGDVIKSNPAKEVKKLKTDIKIDVFTDAQIKQMLTYYRRIKQREKSMFAYRDYTLIVTLLGTGLRLSEARNLKWSDIDFVNLMLTVFGKNRRREMIPITEKLSKELLAYQAFLKQYFDKDIEYVFVNNRGKQISDNAIKCIFKRLAKIMNFKDVRLSAHTFRHTFCQRCIQQGMSTFAVQKLMRHSSIAVTEKYAAMWGNDLKEQNDKYNPLNNLDV